MSAPQATFDDNDHCITEGWATYQKRPPRRLCRLLRRHVLPIRPGVADGIRPDNYAICHRCDLPIKWFVVGQHRYGGYNKDVFDQVMSGRNVKLDPS